MRSRAISLGVMVWLSLAGCSLRSGGTKTRQVAAAPKPAAPARPAVDTASELPISVPQTQVNLPSPQPIQAEALATVHTEPPPPPEAPNPATRPPRNPPRAEPRQQATVPAQPAGPVAPPANPPVSRPRIRPVETPAERQRLLAGITARQRQVQDVLGKAKNRQLNDAERNAVERIQSFVEQTEAALKDQDLQQAEALSNRALALCQTLGEK